MQDAIDSGIPISAAHNKNFGDKTKEFKERRIDMLAPSHDAKAVDVPCVHDPSKDCILCEMFDECPYPDRKSSLMSVGVALILTSLLLVAALFWFLMR